MGSYFVSTPRWTVRVDVERGVIQPTSAPYMKSAYGQAWETWLNWARRQYGVGLRVTCLEADKKRTLT